MSVVQFGDILEEMRHPQTRRLSQVLVDIVEKGEGPVSVSSIRAELGDRSFSAFLALFALINCLPLPPGSSFFLGIPLLLISAQMVAGYKRIWLPELVLVRTIDREMFRSMVTRVNPWVVRMETMVRPRYWPFASQAIADRLLGVLMFILSFIIFLPIPLGNWLPAYAVLFMAISLIERDGLWLLIAALTTVVAVLVLITVFRTAAFFAASMF